MDKIAAYTVALQELESEKRAEHIIENFGTCEGNMPVAYLVAYDRMMEKDAFLQATGKAVTGGIYRLGRALGSAGESGARTGIGGKMMDFASGISGKPGTGAARARAKEMVTTMRNAGGSAQDIRDLGGIKGMRENAQKIIGGTALGLGALGTVGAGYAASRMMAPQAPPA
jgi:hypothetical protein